VTAGAYSIREVQQLLATLVASKPRGRIAEIGTSYGEGARAIVAPSGSAATIARRS
jgi:predicted O-methyltransferase YrrM